jgi:hypothetical protein
MIMKTIKIFSLSAFILFSISNSFSQIYAKNAYLYVADNYIFAKGNVNLDTGGNIFLRNESQLLQATTGVSQNTGVGKLSAFQEGTANAFKYNYWCSPVGDATTNVGNENFGIEMFNRPTGVITSTAAFTTPQAGFNGISNPLAIEPYWIWKYLSSDGYNLGGPNGWLPVNATKTLLPGEGFTMKGTSGIDATSVLGVQNNVDGSHQRYDFRGKPNDGNIDIFVSPSKFTLTGNPYPCAMDLSNFLFSSTNTTGTAYFWEQDKLSPDSHYTADYVGGYGTFVPVSTTSMGVYNRAVYYQYGVNGFPVGGPTGGLGGIYQRRFCPIGQGFMIEGKAALAGPTLISMNNSYRVFKKEDQNPDFSHFERNSNNVTTTNFLSETPSVSGFDYTTVSTTAVPQIKFISLINDVALNQITLGFDNAATDEIDFAMDGKSANDENPVEVYFVLDNKPFVIDIIQFDVNKKIPIGLRNTDPANFKIKVDEILNFNDADHVYVHDKDLNIYTEITNGTDFYEVNMPAGDIKTRFEITFTNSPLSIDENVVSDFQILQNNSTQFLTVNNPKNIDIKEVLLYDLAGKLIFSKSKLGNDKNYKFSTVGLSEAIYIVNVVTNDNVKQGQKISVFKQK